MGIGISVFAVTALLSCSALAPTVTFDGKMLHFPRDHRLNPVDISTIKFDFENIPDDKHFIEGKVFKFELARRSRHNRGRRDRRGTAQYAIFTKWSPVKIEILYYPVSNLQAVEKTFLDCGPDGSNSDAYACVIRGYTVGNTYRMMFKYFLFNSGQKIVMGADDGAVAYSEVVGEFPVPAGQTVP